MSGDCEHEWGEAHWFITSDDWVRHCQLCHEPQRKHDSHYASPFPICKICYRGRPCSLRPPLRLLALAAVGEMALRVENRLFRDEKTREASSAWRRLSRDLIYTRSKNSDQTVHVVPAWVYPAW